MPPETAHTRDRSAPSDEAPAAAANPTLAHFSQGGLHGGGGMPPVFASIMPVLFVLLVGIVPLQVLLWSANVWWLPFPIRLSIILLLLAVSVWILGRLYLRAYKRGTIVRGLPFKMDESARVNVICWVDQQHDLQPLGDVAFEPELFRVFVPDRLPAWIRREHNPRSPATRRKFWALMWLCVYGPFIVIRFVSTPATQNMLGIVVYGGVLIVGGLVAAWLYRKPTYLRVVPGRADLLRYPALGGAHAGPDVETIDLRAVPVRLDLKRGVLMTGAWNETMLKHTNPWTHAPYGSPATTPTRTASGKDLPELIKDPHSKRFPLWAIPNRDAATRALYLASISTADHGPLPEPRGV